MKPRGFHRHRRRCPFWAIADAPVWFVAPGDRYPAVIDTTWFAVGEARWMARLRDVEVPGGSRMRIAAVPVDELVPRRVEPTSRSAPAAAPGGTP